MPSDARESIFAAIYHFGKHPIPTHFHPEKITIFRRSALIPAQQTIKKKWWREMRPECTCSNLRRAAKPLKQRQKIHFTRGSLFTLLFLIRHRLVEVALRRCRKRFFGSVFVLAPTAWQTTTAPPKQSVIVKGNNSYYPRRPLYLMLEEINFLQQFAWTN